MSIIESDALVATSLMRTVGGHLSQTVETLRAMRNYTIEKGVDFSNIDAR